MASRNLFSLEASAHVSIWYASNGKTACENADSGGRCRVEAAAVRQLPAHLPFARHFLNRLEWWAYAGGHRAFPCLLFCSLSQPTLLSQNKFLCPSGSASSCALTVGPPARACRIAAPHAIQKGKATINVTVPSAGPVLVMCKGHENHLSSWPARAAGL